MGAAGSGSGSVDHAHGPHGGAAHGMARGGARHSARHGCSYSPMTLPMQQEEDPGDPTEGGVEVDRNRQGCVVISVLGVLLFLASTACLAQLTATSSGAPPQTLGPRDPALAASQLQASPPLSASSSGRPEETRLRAPAARDLVVGRKPIECEPPECTKEPTGGAHHHGGHGGGGGDGGDAGDACCDDDGKAECLACQVDRPLADLCLDRKYASMDGCEGFCGLVEDSAAYPGGDIRSQKTDSMQACCSLCRNERQCTSWTWAKRASSADYGVCYLKGQRTLRREVDDGYISGLPGKEVLEYELRLQNRLQGDLCLTSPNGDGGEGVAVLSACGSAPNAQQQWSYDRAAGLVIVAGSGSHGDSDDSKAMCLDAHDADRTGGSLVVRKCEIGSISQRWVFDSSGGRVENAFGFCWEPLLGMPGAVVAAGAGNGAKVQLAACRANAVNQRWTFLVADYGEGMDETTSTTRTITHTTTPPPTTTSTATGSTKPDASLFCWALMLPWGYEPDLLRMQIAERRSIFACEDFSVYSSVALDLGSGYTTRKVDMDLHCPLGGVYHTALNTPIFMAIWGHVIEDGQYQYHEWTVKADPDAVFMPGRLRDIVSKRPLTEGAASKAGVFLNNCKYGLHGPLEVVSRRALKTFAGERWRCKKPPQEDVYLQHCMLTLGVQQANQWSLLAEAACKSPDWESCHSAHAAFHPFKDLAKYRQCEVEASRRGTWEPDQLRVAPASEEVRNPQPPPPAAGPPPGPAGPQQRLLLQPAPRLDGEDDGLTI